MIDNNIQINLLRSMYRIRMVEEEIALRYPEGQMRCPTHLSIGQEAVAAAAGLAFRTDDLAVSGHRAHAHYLGKGGDVFGLIAEIYGKSTGCCRGKGGSMHLVDDRVGFVGSTAIVGGTVPIGVGLGYGIKLRKTKQVSGIFLGDAVAETGVFSEAINFAVLKQLPVLFLCENNLYSVYSPLSVRQPDGREIWRMAEGMGIESHSGDGNNVLEAYKIIAEALTSIRSGNGPVFLEFSTYRWLEHCGPFYDNHIGYRSEAEFLEWKARDPISRLENILLNSGEISRGYIEQIVADIRLEIDKAFEEGLSAPFPPADEAFLHLYA